MQKGPSRVDGALQCLQLRKEKILGTLPSLAVAKELARCMHEVSVAWLYEVSVVVMVWPGYVR